MSAYNLPSNILNTEHHGVKSEYRLTYFAINITHLQKIRRQESVKQSIDRLLNNT